MNLVSRACRHLALAGLIVGAAAVVPARADIANGTFAGAVTANGGALTTVQAGDSVTIPGWTVTSGANDPWGGSVDWIGTYWSAPGGTQSIDLDGNTPGGIRQTIATVAGQNYGLNFQLSQNNGGGSVFSSLNVLIGGTTTPLFVTGYSAYNGPTQKYEGVTLAFKALSSSTLIGFVSTDPANDPYGPVVGDVTLTPEPGFYALLCVGLAGLFVFAKRYRRA